MPEPLKPLDPNVAQDLGRLLLDLSHDKKTRKALGKLVKEAKPDSPHAAAFADVEIEDKFEAFERKQEEAKIQTQRDAILARMNTQRSSLITGGADGAGRKYSEDDVKKIETLMEKKGITDYDDGAAIYAATLPPEHSKPSIEPPTHGSTWEFPEWATFGPDPVKASRNIAHQVISEFQQRKRA